MKGEIYSPSYIRVSVLHEGLSNNYPSGTLTYLKEFELFQAMQGNVPYAKGITLHMSYRLSIINSIFIRIGTLVPLLIQGRMARLVPADGKAIATQINALQDCSKRSFKLERSNFSEPVPTL